MFFSITHATKFSVHLIYYVSLKKYYHSHENLLKKEQDLSINKQLRRETKKPFVFTEYVEKQEEYNEIEFGSFLELAEGNKIYTKKHQ